MDNIKSILKELLDFEVKNKEDLKAWNKLAEQVYIEDKESPRDLPEVVWHYLDDAGIRLKEPEYGLHQIEGVKEYIQSKDS